MTNASEYLETREPVFEAHLTLTECNTILAALRHWQANRSADAAILDIAADSGNILTDDDIDDLCGILNLN